MNINEEFPVRVNLMKFLGEERRHCVLDFAKEKIHANPGQELDYKIFSFLVSRQSNILSELVESPLVKEKTVKKD
jgi:hypothetical protein